MFSSSQDVEPEFIDRNTKLVKFWSVDDVGKWLDETGNGAVKKLFKEQEVDGEVLLEMSLNDLKEFDMKLGTRKKLFVKIEELKKRCGVDGTDSALKNVIAKMEKLKGSQDMTSQEKIDKARNITFKKDLINTYLNENFIQTKKTFDMIGTEDDIDLNQVQVEDSYYKKFISTRKLKVKIVIVEIHKNTTQRTIRKMLSPVMNQFDAFNTFGMFHSALIVGPWYLEWNDSSLCIPRKCYSNAAVLVADVSQYFEGPKIAEAIDAISDVICHWNASYTYSSQTYNCQTFIDELCKELGIILKFDDALGQFVNKLRQYGSCDMKYKGRDFKTHQELDEYVLDLLKKDPKFPQNHSNDYALLKSFDRAFWLRYYKDKNEISTPHDQCPFGNPHDSQSLYQNVFTY